MKIIAGKENIQKNHPDLLFDESRFTLGVPQAVYYPQSTSDVRTIALKAAKIATPLTLMGARTGLTGGSVPVDNCVAVCFSDMNKILRVFHKDNGMYLVCQPGITLQEIATFCENSGLWPYTVENADLLSPAEWFYAPDPTEMTAQLGGTVATNASGARSYFYRSTRASIYALSLVFANGHTTTLCRGTHKVNNGCFTLTTDQGLELSITAFDYQSIDLKNASGYYAKNGMDLLDLFIGSEGTLALFTEITVQLVKTPELAAGLSFFSSRMHAFSFASFLRNRENIAAIEYFDESALGFLRKHAENGPQKIPAFPNNKTFAVYWEHIETTSNAFENISDEWENALTENGSSFDDTWSGFDKKEITFLKHVRHLVPECVNAALAAYKRECPAIRKISTDAAFPEEHFLSATEKYVVLAKEAHLEYALFGHLGDFHLHLNLLPHNEEELKKALAVYDTIMDLVIACKGTVSAEHGIGKIKVKYLAKMCGEKAVEEMMRVKTELDPQWLLNPGNLFTKEVFPA